MTNSMSLPPMRSCGGLQISRAPFDDPVLYGRLLAEARRSGRCPVLMSDRALPALHPQRNPSSVLTDVDHHDAAELLADRWPGTCPCSSCGTRFAPFGLSFPGLAPQFADAADLQPDAVVRAAVRMASDPRHMLLGLAPADRPADVPAAAGWTGMCNSWDDVAEVSAVLRSWEDRFGAVLVRMHRSVLELAVAAPPWSRQDCERVAAEHVAFTCDDDSPTPKTLRQHAQSLSGARQWWFWWD
jgi:hypothetical protein